MYIFLHDSTVENSVEQINPRSIESTWAGEH